MAHTIAFLYFSTYMMRKGGVKLAVEKKTHAGERKRMLEKDWPSLDKKERFPGDALKNVSEIQILLWMASTGNTPTGNTPH